MAVDRSCAPSFHATQTHRLGLSASWAMGKFSCYDKQLGRLQDPLKFEYLLSQNPASALPYLGTYLPLPPPPLPTLQCVGAPLIGLEKTKSRCPRGRSDVSLIPSRYSIPFQSSNFHSQHLKQKNHPRVSEHKISQVPFFLFLNSNGLTGVPFKTHALSNLILVRTAHTRRYESHST